MSREESEKWMREHATGKWIGWQETADVLAMLDEARAEIKALSTTDGTHETAGAFWYHVASERLRQNTELQAEVKMWTIRADDAKVEVKRITQERDALLKGGELSEMKRLRDRALAAEKERDKARENNQTANSIIRGLEGYIAELEAEVERLRPFKVGDIFRKRNQTEEFRCVEMPYRVAGIRVKLPEAGLCYFNKPEDLELVPAKPTAIMPGYCPTCGHEVEEKP